MLDGLTSQGRIHAGREYLIDVNSQKYLQFVEGYCEEKGKWSRHHSKTSRLIIRKIIQQKVFSFLL